MTKKKDALKKMNNLLLFFFLSEAEKLNNVFLMVISIPLLPRDIHVLNKGNSYTCKTNN